MNPSQKTLSPSRSDGFPPAGHAPHTLRAGMMNRERASRSIMYALLSLAICHAATGATLTWTGPDTVVAPWSTTAYWGGRLPTNADGAWFNVANTAAVIQSGIAAQALEFVLGRTVKGATLEMTGGTLSAASHIYVGQYAGGSGQLTLSGGTITGQTDFTMGSAGHGVLFMSGGAINTSGRFIVNRYASGEDSGYAQILGGTIRASELLIGENGAVVMDGATFTLRGDRRNAVNALLSSGALSSFGGFTTPISATFHSGLNETTVTSIDGRQAGQNTFGPETLGQRAISLSYTGTRRLPPAPPGGLHPRILFGMDELPAIRTRLSATAVGKEAFKMIQIYSSILRNGRSAGYDNHPVYGSQRTMPDGSARISNPGVYDRSVAYNQLATGVTTQLAAMEAANDATGLSALGGMMALEAFECLVLKGESGISTRAAALATALDTWASWANAQASFPGFGDCHTALAYDFNHGSMTNDQRNHVRKALAKTLASYVNEPYYGSNLAPEATASNWTTLNSHMVFIPCAIEGEVASADAGFTDTELDSWMTGTCKALHKFFTYGWWGTGAPYEGQGKNYTFAANLIPLARRGYDFFGHPHVKAYAERWLPAIIQPYGYAFTSYDVLGGSGIHTEKGKYLVQPNDFIGLKWMYPTHTGVDFAWRNFVNTEYKTSSGTYQTFLDLRDSKFALRMNFGNNLLAAAIFASDVASSSSWTTHNTAALGALDYLDTQGGTLISRSAYDANATALNVHIRQDFGGHTHADRNTFTLSALGRLFVNYNSTTGQSAEMQGSDFQSVISVDNMAMKVTEKEGDKMRIPGKIAGWARHANAHFITGDATYAYSNEWWWAGYPVGGNVSLQSGFVADNNTFNTFRRSNNKLAEAYANTPFVAFPNWNAANSLEGIQKKPYNPMRQVYRTIGLVRGTKPYVIIVDDVQKDAAAHTYKWFASVPNDLMILTGNSLPAGANAATDVVLQEPSTTGNRRLLVRVLRANGTPVKPAGSSGSSLAYIHTLVDAYGNSHNRLVVERASVVTPEFRVLLFPFVSGEPLPTTNWEGNDLSVNLAAQSDIFTFHPRTATIAGQTVTMNEFTLKRGGSTLIDYRNQIEPIPVR